jgi:hypothetical protein
MRGLGSVDAFLLGACILLGLSMGQNFFSACSQAAPRVIRFPERRTELAKIRDEVAELRRTISVR